MIRVWRRPATALRTAARCSPFLASTNGSATPSINAHRARLGTVEKASIYFRDEQLVRGLSDVRCSPLACRTCFRLSNALQTAAPLARPMHSRPEFLGFGIGLRDHHAAQILVDDPALDWLEI